MRRRPPTLLLVIFRNGANRFNNNRRFMSDKLHPVEGDEAVKRSVAIMRFGTSERFRLDIDRDIKTGVERAEITLRL